MFHVKQKRVAFRRPAGVCLLCRLPTLPFVCLSAPIPPTPFPRGEGGDFWFSYARGSAPCIPGVEPGRHWLFSAMSALFAPIPPAPLPGGKGETKVILCKGLRPLHPWGLSPGGTGYFLPRQCFLPHPPDPLPGGKGEIFVLFCRGLAPPAPLRLSPDGIGFFCRVSAFLPPSPCPALAERSSRREGGDFWFSYARGSAPAPLLLKPGQH